MTWSCYASGLPGRPTGQGSGSAAIESRTGEGSTTVFISGELDLLSAPTLCEHLARVLRGQPRRLILDLSRTEFIDCGSARLLAGTGRSLPPGQRPVIRRPPPGVRRVFQLTGLDAHCEMED
jgi:anti-sigma B factor antagonist